MGHRTGRPRVSTRALLIAAACLGSFSCADGGGAGCAGCATEPIPGGFPAEARVENAAQLRLTESGVAFLEDNAMAVLETALGQGLTVEVPEVRQSLLFFNLVFCPGGGCRIEASVQALALDPVEPNRLDATLAVVLASLDEDGERDAIRVNVPGRDCLFDIDTTRGDRDTISLTAQVSFLREERDPRAGFTRIDVQEVTLSEDFQNADLDISALPCSGFGCITNPNLFCFLADLGPVKDLVIGLITGPLTDAVGGLTGDALCQTRGEAGCPDGTFALPDEEPTAICRYEEEEAADCVPSVLGVEGQGDIAGALLSGVSPGTRGYGRVLFALGGEGVAEDGGLSLGFVGGYQSTDATFSVTPGHDACVPVVEPPPIPELDRALAFRGNVIPGTDVETHVALGVPEAFLDHAAYHLFDSGGLCVAAGTPLSQQLTSGLFSLLIRSLGRLTFPDGNAPLSLVLRPQQPPDVTVGTQDDAPLLALVLPELAIDFYVWASERYVRFMTFTTDLELDLDLDAVDGAVVPRITRIRASGSSVTNAELLSEDPAAVALVLESLLGEVVGGLLPELGAVELPSVMGFGIALPDGGILGVEEDGARYLGLFGDLELGATAALVAPVDTHVTVSDLRLDEASLELARFEDTPDPSLWLELDADAPPGAPVEFRVRLDHGPWSAWDSRRRLQLSSPVLRLQARHRVEAMARIVGDRASLDPTPATAEVLVDIRPPLVRLTRDGETLVVHASDRVSGPEQLEARVRFGDGAWSAWGSLGERADTDPGAPMEAEVRDEAGNLGRASAGLVRGLPRGAEGACACRSVGGSGSSGGLGWLLLLVGVVGLRLRRRRPAPRRRRAGVALLLTMPLLLAAGCECGTPTDGPDLGADAPLCEPACAPADPPLTSAGEVCCEAEDRCVAYDLDALCDPGFTCLDAAVVVDGACSVTCASCEALPPLDAGLLATHLDAVRGEDGVVYLSGYSIGVPDAEVAYGDLVFGRVSPEEREVTWEVVDGVPDGPVVGDPNGWRGGVRSAGPDVGRWTSLAEREGTFFIAYRDDDGGALRMAVGVPGAFAIHEVDARGDSGRYASLVLRGGIPAVAYLRIERSLEGGQVRGTVQVATALVPTPAGPEDWARTEVASAVMPCRAELCSSGERCLARGPCVVATDDCDPACSGATVCSAGVCEPRVDPGLIEDLPPAFGLFTSLAVAPDGGLGVVWYDRTAGDLYGARLDGEGWGLPFVIDGASDGGGDRGLAADLAIDDDSTWHIAYVDGTDETLRYARVEPGGTTIRELVDDGLTADGETRFADGRHLVGDDASIAVWTDGTVQIVYQDATTQDAVAAARGDLNVWNISRIDTTEATGFHAVQVPNGESSDVITFWRGLDEGSSVGGVRVISLD